jgi:hypothetical protein
LAAAHISENNHSRAFDATHDSSICTNVQAPCSTSDCWASHALGEVQQQQQRKGNLRLVLVGSTLQEEKHTNGSVSCAVIATNTLNSTG